ncbi:hypothetical protein PG985_005133 [Apiospora marii]
MDGYPHGAGASSLSAHFSRVSSGVSQTYGGGPSYTQTMGYTSYTHEPAPSWSSSGPLPYAPPSQEPWADAAARYAQQQQQQQPPHHYRPHQPEMPTTQPASSGDGPPPAYSYRWPQ